MKVKVKIQGHLVRNVIFKDLKMVYLNVAERSKVTSVKIKGHLVRVKGHIGKGQSKDFQGRQVGSQCQVASLIIKRSYF